MNQLLLEKAVDDLRAKFVWHGDYDASSVLDAVLYEAVLIFSECPEDLCIQDDSNYPERLIFGGSNRVVWSITRGFDLHETYCTENFIKHYHDHFGGSKL